MAAVGILIGLPGGRLLGAAAVTATPLEIRDLSRHEAQGTRIGSDEAEEEGIKTITCQRNMAVMLLQNRDARRQVGVTRLLQRRNVGSGVPQRQVQRPVVAAAQTPDKVQVRVLVLGGHSGVAD